MTNDPALLVHRYLEGSLETAEILEFNERVRADSEFRALLARMSFDEVALRELIGPAEARPVPAPVQASAGRWHWMATRGSVAAAAVLLVGIVALLVFSTREPAFVTVASGRVLVDGVETSRFMEGARITVVGDEPAMLRFPEGSTADLEPKTEAVLRRGSVELCDGVGRFKGALSVLTPFGISRSRQASFRAESRPDHVDFEVSSGSLEIDRGGLRSTIGAGGRRLLHRENTGAANKDWVKLDRLLGVARMTLAEAISRAERDGALAVKAELEDEKGLAAIAMDLSTGARSVEVTLNAVNGDVLENDLESEDLSALASGIRLSDAIKTAVADTPGKVVKAEFKFQKERLIARVKIIVGERLLRVLLDGRTGAVIDRQVDEVDED